MHEPYSFCIAAHISVVSAPISGQIVAEPSDVTVFKWLFKLEQCVYTCDHYHLKMPPGTMLLAAAGSLVVDQSKSA